jgi:AraC-like DNA-binding protein
MASADPDRPCELKTHYAQPPLRSTELEIEAIGAREWMTPGIVDRRRGTEDWLLMFFHQEVDVGVGRAIVRSEAGSLVIWRPRSAHLYGRRDRAWNHSWIHAQGTLLERMVAELDLPVDTPIAGVDPAWIEHCVHAIHREIASHAQPDAVIIANALHTFLREVARARRPAEGPVVPAKLLAARRHLEAHFAEPTGLDVLAHGAGLSPNHFCGEFRRWFGTSPIDFLISLRLERARLLLRDRNESIGAVAKAVGYADPHYFSKLVRRRFGCSPSALR